MEQAGKSIITVNTTVNAPVEKVWDIWTKPGHIVKWNSASDDWHTTRAENDLRQGGQFSSRMEAKDGSFGFDFAGKYDIVELHKIISYTMGDGRRVEVNFDTVGDTTHITQSFDAEETNSLELQQGGWQAIMDSFRKYAESV